MASSQYGFDGFGHAGEASVSVAWGQFKVAPVGIEDIDPKLSVPKGGVGF
jgi:hypothetical protein